MAKANKRANSRIDAEPGGLWHQPALMNLVADLLILCGIVALVWAGLTLLQRMPVFPLREVVVTNVPARVAVQQIEDVTRSTMAGNFFTVDLEAVRQAYEKLPWVRKAAVRRTWPDGLALTIEEHEVLARWRHFNGDLALVNRQGELFVAEHPASGTLPLLSGPDGSSGELLGRYLEFAAALGPTGRQIDSITLSPRRAWRLKLDNGLAVDLGRDEERHPLEERLARFVTHYDKLKPRFNSLQVADMRYPSGFAVVGELARTSPASTSGRRS